MDSTISTIKVGQKIPKEILKLARKEYKAAKKKPYVYDPDCPPSSPEVLAEFAAMARERDKNKRNPLKKLLYKLNPIKIQQ